MLAVEVEKTTEMSPHDHREGLLSSDALLVMQDARRVDEPADPAGLAGAQAEVDVLGAVEDGAVQKADAIKDLAAHDLAGADEVIDFARVVAVPFAHFVMRQRAAAVQPLKKTAAAGKLSEKGREALGVVLLHAIGEGQSATGDADFGVCFQGGKDGGQGVFDKFQVSVQYGDVAPCSHGNRLVAGWGNAEILLVDDDANVGESLPQHFRRTIHGAIVDADDLMGNGWHPLVQGIQHPLQEIPHLP